MLQGQEKKLSDDGVGTGIFDELILAASGNDQLGREIATTLRARFVSSGYQRFANSEISIQIEDNVRLKRVVVVGCGSRGLNGQSTNDSAIETFAIIDALTRASVKSITLVLPYYPYSKQEKKTAGRQPITAKVIANFVELFKMVNSVIVVDLHAPAIQGFFDISVDNLYARPTHLEYLRDRGWGGKRVIVVSPDAGGVARARSYAERLGTGFADLSKLRDRDNQIQSHGMAGNVAGYRCLIVDDLVQSGGTLFSAADLLISQGATEVSAVTTHADFCGDVPVRLQASQLKELIVTDTVPFAFAENVIACDKITVLSLVPLLAEAIRQHSQQDGSISKLFD